MSGYGEMIGMALIGYIFGSIPFGLLLTRLAGLGDIRQIGSGNIGATNVLRTGHKSLAFFTLLLDGGKGAVAFFIGYHWSLELALIAGFFAFLGHLFPVWLKFHGGKGVATFLGIMFAINWKLGLIALALWVLIAFVFRFSSLASLLTAFACPFLCWWFVSMEAALWVAVMTVLVFIRHHTNIQRLFAGSESKIGKKSA